MNKFAKISILIGICLVCVGILISAFNFKKLFQPFFSEAGYETKEFFSTNEAITKLIVDIDNDQVKIIPYTGNVLKITYSESEDSKYEIREENQIVILNKTTKICFFCLDFNFKPTQIIIEVPEDLIMEYNLQNDNGKIEINKIKLLDSTFETSNGRFDLKDITSQNDIKLKTSNGRINLHNVTANKIDLTTSNGAVELFGVQASQEILVKSSNGKIEFENLEARSIDFKTSNGAIIGTIIGNAHDYQKNIKTSNGKIEINGDKYTNELNESSGFNKITAKTSNGSIKIDFK